MSPAPELAIARAALMNRLVTRDQVRSEATLQSDVRLLLLDPELGLADLDLHVDLETQVGDRRRIDVEVGCTVIEVKKDLRSQTVIANATMQLSGYVVTRSEQVGQRYVGILTDGVDWIAFHEVEGALIEATRHTASTGSAGASALLGWLEGVLATRQGVIPRPTEIAQRLGANSSSHALDYSTLAALYEDSRDLPTVKLKRELWSNLLESALGTQFTDTDELWLEHTLLVNSAEIIAHLVLGVDVVQLSPTTLLGGSQFDLAGLHGVVDRDFFDWVLEVPGGDGFVRSLARRLSRFDWSSVEHDVLKVLYESVILAETRKTLGEYYTPDWLAEQVVAAAITDPLNQRALDPSCGSGTFLFHAVRRYLDAADEAGLPLKVAMHEVSSRVMGVDLHPVAVALARVTYLLAIGRNRLNSPDRGDLSVPVYLGDSLGWNQTADLLSTDHLVIPTEVGDQLLSGELRFPDHLLADASRFDDLITTLTDESGRAMGKPKSKISEGTIRRLALDSADLPTLNANFTRLRELHEAGRDHVWSYYIRNAARPAWLSRVENRVDVLIGNPPWVSYRHMSRTMQSTFKTMSQERGFWKSDSSSTHQDLAALFVARAVQKYLRSGGRLAFVMPNSVIDRDYWSGFRSGKFGTPYDIVNVAFDQPWDLRRVRPHFFPRGSSVVFGQRAQQPKMMPNTAETWTGKVPSGKTAWAEVEPTIFRGDKDLSVSTTDAEQPRSPYSARFSQGATIVPRVLFMVEPTPASSLGVASGRRAVRSARSTTEKAPWKSLAGLTGTIESEFVWPVLLGESVLPFRLLPAREAVLAIHQTRLLDGSDGRIDAFPGLASWVRETEGIWEAHRSSDRLSLVKQLDYMRKLTQQLPPSPIRVVYGKAGMHVAAAIVADPRAIIDHKLYWASMTTMDEALFLVSILNSPSLTELARPLMSYGKDERDIDKHVWKLPIPSYNGENEDHRQIVKLGRLVCEDVAAMPLRGSNFVTQRKDARLVIAGSDNGGALDEAVRRLLAE